MHYPRSTHGYGVGSIQQFMPRFATSTLGRMDRPSTIHDPDETQLGMIDQYSLVLTTGSNHTYEFKFGRKSRACHIKL